MASATWKVALTTMVPIGVGDDVAEDDPAPAPAHDPDGLDVLADAQGQRFAPDEAAGTSQATTAMTR